MLVLNEGLLHKLSRPLQIMSIKKSIAGPQDFVITDLDYSKIFVGQTIQQISCYQKNGQDYKMSIHSLLLMVTCSYFLFDDRIKCCRATYNDVIDSTPPVGLDGHQKVSVTLHFVMKLVVRQILGEVFFFSQLVKMLNVQMAVGARRKKNRH